jgi:hypothetical protein
MPAHIAQAALRSRGALPSFHSRGRRTRCQWGALLFRASGRFLFPVRTLPIASPRRRARDRGSAPGGGDAAGADRGEDEAPDIVEALGALVDQSLVRQEERRGEPRFALLETIREYALERLREGPDWRDAHDRHAAHYLALAEAAELALRGPAQLDRLERLEVEHDNLRAVLSRFLEGGRIEEAVRLDTIDNHASGAMGSWPSPRG